MKIVIFMIFHVLFFFNLYASQQSTDPFILNMKHKIFISKSDTIYTVLDDGNMTKNGKVFYDFSESIDEMHAYYKLGSFWAGVQYDKGLLSIYPSFSGKKGVRFDKKPIAVLKQVSE